MFHKTSLPAVEIQLALCHSHLSLFPIFAFFNSSKGNSSPEKEMATHSSILAWENSMDRGAWWAIVHGVAKSQTQLSSWAHQDPSKMTGSSPTSSLANTHSSFWSHSGVSCPGKSLLSWLGYTPSSYTGHYFSTYNCVGLIWWSVSPSDHKHLEGRVCQWVCLTFHLQHLTQSPAQTL